MATLRASIPVPQSWETPNAEDTYIHHHLCRKNVGFATTSFSGRLDELIRYTIRARSGRDLGVELCISGPMLYHQTTYVVHTTDSALPIQEPTEWCMRWRKSMKHNIQLPIHLELSYGSA